jgi:hypothetical protein
VPLALPGVRVGQMVVVVAALFATLVLAAPAAAVPSKPYSVAFSATPVPPGVSIPGAMPAGMTIANFTVTLRNDTRTQELGSANVTPPAGFTIVPTPSTPSVDRGNLIAPLADGTQQLRNLNLAPGESVTLTLDLRLPCPSGSYAWTMSAKQSNDYNGTGNDLTNPSPSARTNVVSGACALRFVAGATPAGAAKNLQIRADAYQPDSLDLVSVEAVDGRTPALAQRLTWFTGAIALALGDTAYPGQLVQSGPISAGAGVASFSTLSITAAGVYTLRASTSAGGFATGDPRSESPEFPIDDVVKECAALCTADLGATKITGAPGTDTGLILLSRNVGADPSCAGYKPPVADTWYQFEVTAEREKTILLTYTKPQMKVLKNASALEVCLSTPLGEPFMAKDGPAAPYDYDGDGSLEGFIGLLPTCGAGPGPCVSDRSPLGGGGASIEFVVPPEMGDPRYH